MAAIDSNTTTSTTTGPLVGPRVALLLAVLIDAATLGAALLVAGVAATAFLLLRSRAGSIDPSFRDAAAAVTLCAAVVPAWTAWQWQALADGGATFGGRAVAIAPVRMPTARQAVAARLALHPVSITAWYWLAATLTVLAAPGNTALEWLAAGAGILATLMALLALASLVVRLVRPATRPQLDVTAPAPAIGR